LQGKIHPSGETGINLTKDGNIYDIENLIPTTIGSIKAKAGGDYYGFVHTHPDDCYPMFSFGDLYTLLATHNGTTINTTEVTVMLVVKDDALLFQTYAITISDFAAFNTKIQEKLNNTELVGCSLEKKIELIDRKFGKKYKTNSNYEQAFLKEFKNFGFSLSKANSELTNWSTLSRNFITGNITATPCK
jgi:hypothetical protein